MKQKKIIVAGVSSAGKSTFIAKHLLSEFGHDEYTADSDIDIFQAGMLGDKFNLRPHRACLDPSPLDLGDKAVAIVHYNLLLQFDTTPDADMLDLMSEPVFCALLEHSTEYTVYLCYTPDHILLERIKSRTEFEPLLTPREGIYPADRIRKTFQKIDQRQSLIAFGDAFQNETCDVHVVYSTDQITSILSLDDFRSAAPSERLQKALG